MARGQRGIIGSKANKYIQKFSGGMAEESSEITHQGGVGGHRHQIGAQHFAPHYFSTLTFYPSPRPWKSQKQQSVSEGLSTMRTGKRPANFPRQVS